MLHKKQNYCLIKKKKRRNWQKQNSEVIQTFKIFRKSNMNKKIGPENE